MHVIYKSIKAKSFNCTLGTMTKLKISVLKTVRPPLWKCKVSLISYVNMEPYRLQLITY